MAKEIERKFLVARDDWRKLAGTGSHLQQAYICAAPDRNARVRLIDSTTAWLTLKVGKSSVTRHEFEYEIPVADAMELFDLRLGTLIEKTRYRISHQGFVFEVDEFSGDLSGLLVAEVEMQREDDDPELPDWLGAEVTGNPLYSNQSLAMHGLPTEVISG